MSLRKLQANIYAAHQAGASPEQMAVRFNTPPDLCLAYAGTHRRRLIIAALDAGNSPEQVAKEFGVEVSRVWRIIESEERRKARAAERPPRGSRKTRHLQTAPERKAKVIALHDKGFSYRQIAAQLNMGLSPCYRMIQREKKRREEEPQDVI